LLSIGRFVLKNVTVQPAGGGGVQKMVSPFFEHHPPQSIEE
jgi:hypothetical protein